MEDIDLFAEKIRIAKETQKTKEFMVIGRIESFIVGESKEKALWRAKAYLDAGADGIMIHSKSSKADEILDFAKVYTKEFKNKKPLMCVPTTYHGVKEEELINSGFNIVLYANHLMRASFVAMNKVCEKILEHSRGSEAEELCASLKDLLEPVGSVRTFKAEYEG
jgi:phosphoenolpyruvate phosphomutase